MKPLRCCCVCGYILTDDNEPTTEKPAKGNMNVSHGYCNEHYLEALREMEGQ